MDELLETLDDEVRLDALAEALAVGELATRLAATVGRETHDAARAAFAAGSSRMPELASLGRPGLWIASAALLELLPDQRAMPWPPHERWDALVELHVARPETAWLVADAFAALDKSQAPLARRMLYGVERRFGERGWRALAERGGPHAALISPGR